MSDSDEHLVVHPAPRQQQLVTLTRRPGQAGLAQLQGQIDGQHRAVCPALRQCRQVEGPAGFTPSSSGRRGGAAGWRC